MTSETKQAVHTIPFDTAMVTKMHAPEKALLDVVLILDHVTPATVPPTYVSQTLFSPNLDVTKFFDTCSRSLPNIHWCIVTIERGVSKHFPGTVSA